MVHMSPRREIRVPVHARRRGWTTDMLTATRRRARYELIDDLIVSRRQACRTTHARQAVSHFETTARHHEVFFAPSTATRRTDVIAP